MPFDAVRAHALYKGLFGEVEDLIKGKHLIVVPSGALTQLPFQVLVTQPLGKNPTTYGDYRGIAWFARSRPVTVLPAVSSLKALRRNAQSSQATKPFLGIGNALLDGPDQRYAWLRQAALDITVRGSGSDPGCGSKEPSRRDAHRRARRHRRRCPIEAGRSLARDGRRVVRCGASHARRS